MKIAVDTSVWIDFLRDDRTPEMLLLRDIIAVRPESDRTHRIVVGDLVLCEVLRGITDPFCTVASNFSSRRSKNGGPVVARSQAWRHRSIAIYDGRA